MDIGKRIRFWRNERGLTQLRLAEKANISRSYLAGVEAGNYNPSLDTLNSIAAALNMNPSELLGDISPTALTKEKAAPKTERDPLTTELIALLDTLDQSQKEFLLAQIRTMKERGV